jgi:TIR domain
VISAAPRRRLISFCAAIICATSSSSFCASTSGERVGFQSRMSRGERFENTPSSSTVITKKASSPPNTTVNASTAAEGTRARRWHAYHGLVGTVFLSYRRTEQPDADAIARRLGDRWRIVSLPAKLGEWQDRYRELVRTADAVVCIVGEHTADSPHVDCELETAFELGRRVIAMRSPGTPAPRVPTPLAGSTLIEPDDVAARLAVVERTQFADGHPAPGAAGVLLAAGVG